MLVTTPFSILEGIGQEALAKFWEDAATLASQRLLPMVFPQFLRNLII